MDYSIWDWDKKEDIPFFGNKQQLDELTSLTTNCLRRLEEATSARDMVLETWLTVDFALRQFLISGFELHRFCDEDFDLRYILLSSSFRELLKLLKDTKEHYNKYPIEPEPAFTDKVGGFKSSAQFWRYVKEEHPDLLEKIAAVTDEYRIKMNPELHNHIVSRSISFGDSSDQPESKVEKMNLGWIKVADKLDDKWIDSAEHLNKARNSAAHSPSIDKIGRCFGLKGENITELIRDRCRAILETLLGVSSNEK